MKKKLTILFLLFLLRWFEQISPRFVIERKLEVRLQKDREPELLLGTLFREYLSSHRLLSVTTTKNPQSIEIHYLIRLLRPEAIFSFFRAMTLVDGVESVEFKDSYEK